MPKKIVDEETLEIKEVVEEIKGENKDAASNLEVAKNRIREALNCSVEEFYQKYRDYKEAQAKFEEVYNPLKKTLIQLHKEAPNFVNTIIVGGAKLTYVSPSVRTSIDTKRLKEEEPELAKKFTKITNVEATIRLEDTYCDEKWG